MKGNSSKGKGVATFNIMGLHLVDRAIDEFLRYDYDFSKVYIGKIDDSNPIAKKIHKILSYSILLDRCEMSNGILSLGGSVYAICDDNTLYITTILDTMSLYSKKVSNAYYYVDISGIDVEISNVDTSKLSNAAYLFKKVSVGNLDLSNFDTSNIVNAEGMFYGICVSGDKKCKLDLRGRDFSHLDNAKHIFGLSLIDYLDLSDCKFNADADYDRILLESDIDTLNVSGVSGIDTMIFSEYTASENVKNLIGALPYEECFDDEPNDFLGDSGIDDEYFDRLDELREGW